MPATQSSSTGIKRAAAKLVSSLPATASWEDLMHEIYVRKKIESGLSDIKAGRVIKHAAIRKEFGLA